MGGGPYRPGSGITPPQLVKEVKADYTEEARRRSIEGEVLLEIVVRRDGSVGDVRLINGLPSGLKCPLALMPSPELQSPASWM